MNELERYVDEVCRGLRGSQSLREHVREELREHLLAAVEKHAGDGLAREEATAKAIEEFGRPEMVREGLEAVYGRRFIAVLIEKAMEWKAGTIKTGWKWSFVAHLCLAGVVAVEVMLILALAVFILPLLTHEYGRLGANLPGYSQSAFWLLAGAWETWFVWLAVIAVAWGIFEWRCRSENKRTIRLAIGALAGLVVTVAAWLISAAVVVPMVRLPQMIRSQQTPSGIRRTVAQAGASFERLSRAADSRDWAGAEEPAHALRQSLRLLADTHLAAAALAAMHQREDVRDIRLLLDDLAELSEDVYDSIHRGTGIEAQIHFLRLKESYEQLGVKVRDWPSAPPSPATQPAATRPAGNY
ncbi:MAG: permease prefix domain 1-containing protein [Phycisphaerae bacterium]